MNGTTGVYAGALVALLGSLLPIFGVHLSTPQLTSAVQAIFVLAGVVGAALGHHSRVLEASGAVPRPQPKPEAPKTGGAA